MGTRAGNNTGGGGTTSTGSSALGRRSRYARSSTVSVTQMLSDSCSSLLNRLTSRVRGPSAAVEPPVKPTPAVRHHHHALSTKQPDQENVEPPRRLHRRDQLHASTTSIDRPHHHHHRNRLDEATRSRLEEKYSNSTRTRLEDQYAAALERYSRRKERENSDGRSLTKSATTHSVLLAEKAYPYVTASSVVREKTPFRTERSRRHVTEARQPHKIRPLRAGNTAELNDSRLTLVPTSPPAQVNNEDPSVAGDVDTDRERDVKRKEIQSLINKYTALDDEGGENLSALARCQQKYSSYLSQSKQQQQQQHQQKSHGKTRGPSAVLKPSSALQAPLPLALALVSASSHLYTHTYTVYTRTGQLVDLEQ